MSSLKTQVICLTQNTSPTPDTLPMNICLKDSAYSTTYGLYVIFVCKCCVIRLSVVVLSVAVLRQLSRNIKRLSGKRRCFVVLRDAAS